VKVHNSPQIAFGQSSQKRLTIAANGSILTNGERKQAMIAQLVSKRAKSKKANAG